MLWEPLLQKMANAAVDDDNDMTTTYIARCSLRCWLLVREEGETWDRWKAVKLVKPVRAERKGTPVVPVQDVRRR